MTEIRARGHGQGGGQEAGKGRMAHSEGRHSPTEVGTKTVGSTIECNSLEHLPPQDLAPALTKAAVDDSKAAAKGTHQGRCQFRLVLGFQDTSWVWRLWELLIKGLGISLYGQGQKCFFHGPRGDGHRAGGQGQVLLTMHVTMNVSRVLGNLQEDKGKNSCVHES